MRRRVGDGDNAAKKREREGGATRHRRHVAAGRQGELERLSRELSEAHEHQAAASEVLGIISRSPKDAQPVFDAIVQSAARLCGSAFSIVQLFDGQTLRLAATYNFTAEALAHTRRHQAGPDRSHLIGRAIVERAVVHVADVLADTEYSRELALAGGWRAVLAVPMLRDGEPVGAIAVAKNEPVAFSERQVRLLGIFADQAVIAIENARRFEELEARTRELEARTGELSEALEQQTATSEVLRAVSGAHTDALPVFAMIARSAARLCRARLCFVYRFDGELLHLMAHHGLSAAAAAAVRRGFPMAPGRGSAGARAVLSGAVEHIPDVQADPEYLLGAFSNVANVRSVVAVPMLRDGAPIGAIALDRSEIGHFPERQIRLLRIFADQAVIAIENVRLFTELEARTRDLTEALEQQTATSAILRVISTSPTDVQPVFDTIVRNAVALCGSLFANVFRFDGKLLHFVASHNVGPGYMELLRAKYPMPPDSSQVSGRAVLTRSVVRLEDALGDPDYDHGWFPAAVSWRRMLGVPMLRQGEPLGVIVVGWDEAGPVPKPQEELLKQFADQAVIAIENARLFGEVQARTRELGKALEQQVATSEILRVIASSPTDITPVLNAVAESAARLCGAVDAQIFRAEGNVLRLAASFGSIPIHFRERVIDRNWVTGRAVVDRRTVHVADLAAESESEYPTGLEMQRQHGHRTTLATPLLRQCAALGAILIRRMDVDPFTEDQIRLLEAFADQAVIAIENVRLFTQLETRNAELNEALEQQTATAEVLRVTSNSPGTLEPVFDAVLNNAVRICGAEFGILFRHEAGALHIAATLNVPPAYREYLGSGPLRIGPGTATGRAALTRQAVQIVDLEAETLPEDEGARRATVALGGARTIFSVPMLQEDEIVGAITIYRKEVAPFTGRQIELVGNFARQAAIAIENARLLRELRESLQRQTATADVLKAISRATFDLPTVLTTLVEAAARLCEADQGTIAREQHGLFRRVASHGFSEQFDELIAMLPVARERGSATGRALAEGCIVHIPDVRADPEYTFVEAKELGGFRTILAVPMLREGVAIGVLALTRREVRPFNEKQIELVTTFADQAAIAIENMRLFEAAEARTRDLAQSLEDLRAAQDRLVQSEKLASLGQLTAGIAHEIKNPLNFVNNFAAVSTELVGELQEALAGARLGAGAAEDVAELSQMLRGNLDKIVQHGRRADSIVRNMLLHARQGSGEHRRVDINAIVEESLNLAYHGARAERQGFNITLERAFDPAAGEVDVFPQEITRVLLNLISNGFYAALKRKAASDGRDYAPTLKAATRNLGDRVEITIRDNGTGIPPEVREQLFRPFFTTKPAGEGTGLGLSISHDIIVKQHGGQVAVETRPGEFTEFRIVLPRAAASLAAGASA